jgi:hypothetical protein
MELDPMSDFNRRFILKSMAGALTYAIAETPAGRCSANGLQNDRSLPIPADSARELLKSFVFTTQEVDQLLLGTNHNYISRRYDPLLGYVFTNCRFAHGVDHSICSYNYELVVDGIGPRRMIQFAGAKCRVSTYGDSFTHGDQVNDGETWQEQLAGHLGEPIRNYGVGNYSVYQAYLRMMREERRNPADYVVFTIYDDDHRRSLQPLMPGWGVRPYLRSDATTRQFTEHENPCPTPTSLSHLTELDWLHNSFKELVLEDIEKYSDSQQSPSEMKSLFDQFYYGLTPKTGANSPALIRDALYGTERLVDKIENDEALAGRTKVYVLAYGTVRMREILVEGRRFDKPFLDFLRLRGLPVVDLAELHAEDFRQFHGGMDKYLNRYFVDGSGHYNPFGNAFMAFAIKNQLVRLMKPKPPAYEPAGVSG